MEALKNILNDLDKDGGKEFHTMDSARKFYQRFDQLFQQWKKECKSGKMQSVENIFLILEEELIRREKEGEFQRIKGQNSLAIIYNFKDRLRYLKYEIAKRTQTISEKECDCTLRLSHRIEPDMETLKSFGVAYLYHVEENYSIHECKICKTKWVKGDYRWKEWNAKEYILKINT